MSEFYTATVKKEEPRLGMPQLWISFRDDFSDGYSHIHIIYPDGVVEFSIHGLPWQVADTSRACQADALEACHKASGGQEEFVCNIE